MMAKKNALWAAYQEAGTVKHAEVHTALNEVPGLYKHWQQVASREGYDLKMAKAPLRDIFLRLMPETAPFFGLPAPRGKADRPPQPTPLFDEPASQPQN